MKRKMCEMYDGVFVSFPFLDCIIKVSYHIIFDILRLLHHIRHDHVTDMDTFDAIIIKLNPISYHWLVLYISHSSVFC